MKRLIAVLLALVAVLGGISASPAAAADGDSGLISQGVDLACDMNKGPLIYVVEAVIDSDMCQSVGDGTEKAVDVAWKAVWDSVLGDVIKSGKDVAGWMLLKTFTVALSGPSLDLSATGLFGKDAQLAGMLVWLGWVIATFGLMWQLGKMALTGQMKYAGQALAGWVQNALLTAIGLTIIGSLLRLGDAITDGLLSVTFHDGDVIKRIIAVLLPVAVSNPVMMGGIVLVLTLVGFTQLVLVFLRQSAIPIQCLLLPIAGGGRAGGETTRKWAPRLINSILVVIAYKPILAVIICSGFAQFGHSKTLSEWLRGLATLVLAILAPGPLTKLFGAFSEEVGAGMAGGGASGALSGAMSFVSQAAGQAMSEADSDGGGGDGGADPATPVKQAQYLEQNMGKQDGGGGDGDEGQAGQDALAHAARNGSGVPDQAGAPGVEGAPGAAGLGADATSAGVGVAAAPPTLALRVIDGVNDGLQKGAGEMGGGSE
ncbi:hypothetical protein [Streptomyces noursei]|uniref:hypothetical protein n=1 Tax=Streptomyces noursei TaxID=1971 RepID=UPI0023B7CAB5|nr:hypothetical protein [Streptomyces noursei]